MKKQIFALFTLTALLGASAQAITANAEVSLAECDRCFQTTVNAVLDEDEVGATAIEAVRKPLYDLQLNELGYVYEYEIASGEGYAVIICDEGQYVAQEVVPATPSPYASVETELCVYVNTLTYLKSENGAFYDIATDTELPQTAVDDLMDDAILFQNTGVNNPTEATVVVNYTSRSRTSGALCYQAPQYYPLSTTMSGGCAAVAGSNLIGYYDRFYENLIPNHTAGKIVTGTYYSYANQDSYVQNAMLELYSDMNGTSNGISESNFKSGMQAYCAKRSLNCSFSSIMNWGSLNFDAVKTSIADGKPIALLLSTYNITDNIYWDSANKSETFIYNLYLGNHVMAGFSWREVTYTYANGSTEVCQLVGVSTGWAVPSTGHFNIDYQTNINAAYSVNIY